MNCHLYVVYIYSSSGSFEQVPCKIATSSFVLLREGCCVNCHRLMCIYIRGAVKIATYSLALCVFQLQCIIASCIYVPGLMDILLTYE